MEAESDCFDARAAFKQLAQHIGAQVEGALHEFFCLLKRLPNADFAQQFEHRPLRRGDLRTICALFKRIDVQRLLWRFAKNLLAVILRRKPFCKPLWQLHRDRTVEMKLILLGNVMAYSVPVQRSLAADVESGDHTLQ